MMTSGLASLHRSFHAGARRTNAAGSERNAPRVTGQRSRVTSELSPTRWSLPVRGWPHLCETSVVLELVPYVALAAALVAGGVLSPVPEEATIVAAGVAVAQSGMSLGLAIVFGVIGVVLGDLVLVGFGHASRIACTGVARRASAVRWQPAPAASDRARRLMERSGVLAVVIARFVPGLRGAVFFSSGVVGARLSMVAAVDFAAALIHVPMLLVIGGGLVRC
jgi:membrane protein DedA with SNARE-associated domain